MNMVRDRCVDVVGGKQLSLMVMAATMAQGDGSEDDNKTTPQSSNGTDERVKSYKGCGQVGGQFCRSNSNFSEVRRG